MYEWASPEKERGKRKEGEYVDVHVGVSGIEEVGQLLLKCISHFNLIIAFQDTERRERKDEHFISYFLRWLIKVYSRRLHFL